MHFILFHVSLFWQVEYDISPCGSSAMAANECSDTKKISFDMPRGGYVIYGVAHQHSGGIGAALYRKVK